MVSHLLTIAFLNFFSRIIVLRQVSTAHVTNGWCLLHCVVVFFHRVITGNHKLEKTNSTNSDPRPRENTLSNASSGSIGLTLSTSMPPELHDFFCHTFCHKTSRVNKKIARCGGQISHNLPFCLLYLFCWNLRENVVLQRETTDQLHAPLQIIPIPWKSLGQL